uniref:Integrase catalytic domain-containing protein n=1 Tax=Chromera velia CCMP2878 TaxID=1169474 RepID=A0A0G4IBF7_9ALVE|eukprot:Cvel_12858.t1-p1 / transcript=Cvel_12858.t1 / gene=Cvel_12858 / organism=Chromera_velia_CCMP2878 / gene_product=hypothetical protein / transcript_product=hypothetical protein / location=Cvel_scaffold857:62921-64139(-) / protein_length=300 / sequence_SO=supercontig / SO=protein_coding / is_pseudo=false
MGNRGRLQRAGVLVREQPYSVRVGVAKRNGDGRQTSERIWINVDGIGTVILEDEMGGLFHTYLYLIDDDVPTLVTYDACAAFDRSGETPSYFDMRDKQTVNKSLRTATREKSRRSKVKEFGDEVYLDTWFPGDEDAEVSGFPCGNLWTDLYTCSKFDTPMCGRRDAADSLMDWINYYGVVPKKIFTDRAPELIGGKFIETCRSFSPPILPKRAPTGIKGILGFAEKPIRTHRNQVRVALDRCLVPSEGGRWGERIPHSLIHKINIVVAIEGDKIVYPTDRKSVYKRRTGEKPDCKFALGD